MKTDLLLIGGGAASAAAAEELRRAGFAGDVVVATRELTAPYHRPPVSKELLVGALGPEPVEIHPPSWWEENGVDLRLRTPVMSIDPEVRTARLGKEDLEFESALLATGAMVRRLSVDGGQLEGIHYLRAPGNAVALRREVEAAEDVVVVGGSFIATEVAAGLTTLGKRCTMVMQEAAPLELALGAVIGDHVRGVLAAHDVAMLPGDAVVAFEGDGRVAAVRTASGRRLAADLVVIGVGAIPDVALARRAGLAIGDTGGVRCDDRLRTSAPAIFTAGDVCEYDSVVHACALRVEHEDHAMEQGRTAARNMLGADRPHDVVPYFWSDIADWLSVESVGPPRCWDRQLVSGAPADGSFTVWYVTDDRVSGAATVGRPADLDTARELIAARAPAESLEAVGATARAAV